jgi:hypothetical protein
LARPPARPGFNINVSGHLLARTVIIPTAEIPAARRNWCRASLVDQVSAQSTSPCRCRQRAGLAAFTSPTNARHSPAVKPNTGPLGSFESRTAKPPPTSAATSTQLSADPLEYEDFTQVKLSILAAPELGYKLYGFLGRQGRGSNQIEMAHRYGHLVIRFYHPARPAPLSVPDGRGV